MSTPEPPNPEEELIRLGLIPGMTYTVETPYGNEEAARVLSDFLANKENRPDEQEISIDIEEEDETFQDLLAAAQSSFDFWNNPLDDEDWNNA